MCVCVCGGGGDLQVFVMALSHALETLFFSISVLFYIHRNHQAYQGLGAHKGHINFHTAPELCSAEMHQLSPLNTKVIRAFYP